MAYVYYEHWLEVGWSSVRIAVVETVPFVLILVLGNIAIQFMYHLGSILEGFIGIFMPNGYLKVCSTYIITSFTFTLHSIYTGSFKVNQKWPISGLKCIFWCFQNQVGLEPEFRKARFENPLLLLSIKKK